jgi:hypothetical protein
LHESLYQKKEGSGPRLSAKDLSEFREEILPYWRGPDGAWDRTRAGLNFKRYTPELKNTLFPDPEVDLFDYLKGEGTDGSLAGATMQHYGHNTLDYRKVFEKGFLGIRKEAEDRLARITLRNEHGHLELAREACAIFGKPCWIVILAGWHEHFREPTEGEMRWQVYGSLAYGVKGIFYFTFWPVRDDYRAIVDYEGNPGPLYPTVRELNAEMLKLGPTLLELESTGVFHTGRSIPQGCTRLPDGLPVSVSQDLPLVVGFLEDSRGSRHAMVVNRDCRRPVSAEVRFSQDVRSVRRISEKEGLATPVPLEGRRATMALKPGGGVLLRLDR